MDVTSRIAVLLTEEEAQFLRCLTGELADETSVGIYNSLADIGVEETSEALIRVKRELALFSEPPF